MHLQGTTHGLLGIVLGLLLGLVLAATVCGTLATLILIENHLHNLLTMAERDRRARK